MGGRSCYEVSLNRKPYYFTRENNRICDIQDQKVINYIFSLPNNAEFEVVAIEPPKIEKPIETINFDGSSDFVEEKQKPKKESYYGKRKKSK